MADKKEYKPTYGFSSYVDKQGIHDALYGDTVANFFNNINQGLTAFMGAVEGRQNAQRQMAFQANQNQLNRDFQAEQNQLDRQFKVDQQQREYNQKIGLMNHQNELDMRSITQKADMDNAIRVKGMAFEQWGNIVSQWIGDPQSNTGIFENLKADSDIDKIMADLNQKITSGFSSGQAESVGFKDSNEYNEWVKLFEQQKPYIEQTLRLEAERRGKIQAQALFSQKTKEYASRYDSNQNELQNNHNFVQDSIAKGLSLGVDKGAVAIDVINAQNARFTSRLSDWALEYANTPNASKEEFIEEAQANYNLFLEDLAVTAEDNGLIFTDEQISFLDTYKNQIEALASESFSEAQGRLQRNASSIVSGVTANTNMMLYANPDKPINLLEAEISCGLKNLDGSVNENANIYTAQYFEQNCRPVIVAHNTQLQMKALLGDNSSALDIEEMSSFMEGLLSTDSGLLANQTTTISLDSVIGSQSGNTGSGASAFDISVDDAMGKLEGKSKSLGYGESDTGLYTSVTTNSQKLAETYLASKNIEANPLLVAVTSQMFDEIKASQNMVYANTLKDTIIDSSKRYQERQEALYDYCSLPYVSVKDKEDMKGKIYEMPSEINGFMEDTGNALVNAWADSMHFQDGEFGISAITNMKEEVKRNILEARNKAFESKSEFGIKDMLDIANNTIESSSASLASMAYENEVDFFSNLVDYLEGKSNGLDMRQTSTGAVLDSVLKKEVIGYDYHLHAKVFDAFRHGGDAISVINEAFGTNLESYKDVEKLVDVSSSSKELAELTGRDISRKEAVALATDIFTYYGAGLEEAVRVKQIDDNFTPEGITPTLVQTPYGMGLYYPNDKTLKVNLDSTGQGQFVAYHITNDEINNRLSNTRGETAPVLSRSDLAGRNCKMKKISSPLVFREGSDNYGYKESIAKKHFGEDIPMTKYGVDWNQLTNDINSGKYPKDIVNAFETEMKENGTSSPVTRFESMENNMDYVLFKNLIYDVPSVNPRGMKMEVFN